MDEIFAVTGGLVVSASLPVYEPLFQGSHDHIRQMKEIIEADALIA